MGLNDHKIPDKPTWPYGTFRLFPLKSLWSISQVLGSFLLTASLEKKLHSGIFRESLLYNILEVIGGKVFDRHILNGDPLPTVSLLQKRPSGDFCTSILRKSDGVVGCGYVVCHRYGFPQLTTS